MDKPTRNAKSYAFQQETYISISLHGRINRWEAVRELLIANQREPNQCCGYAHRIGAVGDFAAYRLKVRYAPGRISVLTLPAIFILDGGTFQPLSKGVPVITALDGKLR